MCYPLGHHPCTVHGKQRLFFATIKFTMCSDIVGPGALVTEVFFVKDIYHLYFKINVSAPRFLQYALK